LEYELIIEELKEIEINSFRNLVNNVFDEFVGKDYSEEGNESFKEYTETKNVIIRFSEKNSKFYVAKQDKDIIGALEIKNNDHISLWFVNKKFHGKGIGRKLFEYYLEKLLHNNIEVKTITVNSSIYAEKIYEKIGFIKTNEMQEKNGIKYIPMEYRASTNVT